MLIRHLSHGEDFRLNRCPGSVDHYKEHFEGVEFSYGYPPKDEDTIVVSEAVCSKFIRLACEKYLQRHPEDTEKVKELLDKLSFWP
ncbi:ribonuclease toxin immunity protein CdiI [Pseudomonas aeruginosa]|uniref:ribonuclease toxin immunity protein CdiI n=1 Tax=Pseudomonas aeruginosa TaxID=287 RepID=UPI001D0A21FF|nr:ribonuclease toxin immunity protein CdiI [Pseudomonas aeruginosa]MCC0562498.1 ribonuclease toxin immunity protein CdiI [Pseudomonas aeruginosa]